MKWKIRLARDMAQEAYVVIEAVTAKQAEAIFWNDVDPDVIDWPNCKRRSKNPSLKRPGSPVAPE